MAVLVTLAVIIALGFLVSLRRHPWRRCRACNGTGRHFGSVYKYSHRGCTRCGGNGRRARAGVRTFHKTAQVWGERAPNETSARRSANLGR